MSKTALVKEYMPLYPLLFIIHTAVGMAASAIGTSLQYLAINTGVNMEQVSYVYIGRCLSYMLFSALTSFTFPRLKKSSSKFMFLGTSMFICIISMLSIPFVRSFPLLLFCIALYGGAAAIADTGDNNLAVYLLGATHSKSLVQMLHFSIAMGALLCPLMAKPFLVKQSELIEESSVCPTFNRSTTSTMAVTTTVSYVFQPLINGSTRNDNNSSGWQALNWPFSIIAIIFFISMLACLGFAMSGFRLNAFLSLEKGDNDDDDMNVQRKQIPMKHFPRMKFHWTVLVLFFFFYLVTTGTENIFWSHGRTFGLCSGLQLSTGEATDLATYFFAGFMVGRGSGIFIAYFFKPVHIMIVQLSGCVIATAGITFIGTQHRIAAFAFFALYGFSVSSIFGLGINWVAQHVDYARHYSAVNFLGAFTGIMLYPVIVGIFFQTEGAGAQAMAYLTLVSSLLSSLLFLAMCRLAQIKVVEETEPQAAAL